MKEGVSGLLRGAVSTVGEREGGSISKKNSRKISSGAVGRGYGGWYTNSSYETRQRAFGSHEQDVSRILFGTRANTQE